MIIFEVSYQATDITTVLKLFQMVYSITEKIVFLPTELVIQQLRLCCTQSRFFWPNLATHTVMPRLLWSSLIRFPVTSGISPVWKSERKNMYMFGSS